MYVASQRCVAFDRIEKLTDTSAAQLSALIARSGKRSALGEHRVYRLIDRGLRGE